MKALVTSLAVAILLCVSILISSALANPATLCCGGPYDGCPYSGPTCYASGGTCPDTGQAYGAVIDYTLSVWSCVSLKQLGCNDNILYHWCLLETFDSQNHGICGTFRCNINQDVLQCQKNMCN